MSLLLLILMLAVALALTSAAAVVLMARMLLRPARMTDGKAAYVLHRLSPADLGLPYENVTFETRDALSHQILRLAAWWIAANDSTRCAIVIHGYADAKVGGIAWAPLFHSLGYNVLAIDLRAHGESSGKFCTGGYYERDDVSAIINDIRTLRPRETQQLILFGVSLGAAVALATAEMRDDVNAVIIDSPFADYRKAAIAHADLLGLPARLLPALAVRVAESWSRADFAAVAPVNLLPKIDCPVLAILIETEALNDREDAAALDAALVSRLAAAKPTQIWRTQASHALALAEKTDEYIAHVREFLRV